MQTWGGLQLGAGPTSTSGTSARGSLLGERDRRRQVERHGEGFRFLRAPPLRVAVLGLQPGAGGELSILGDDVQSWPMSC